MSVANFQTSSDFFPRSTSFPSFTASFPNMPAIHGSTANQKTLERRLVTNDNGDVDVPRILGLVAIIVLILVILLFVARTVKRRNTRRQPYNTRRNQGVVRVQRLVGSGNSNRDGDNLPMWSERLDQPIARVPEETLVAPPPVYKRQDSTSVHVDPPPAYSGRGAAS